MPADELGSIWNSDPVRVTQSVKSVGKEHDKKNKERQDEQKSPEREHDSFEPSSEQGEVKEQLITINQHSAEDMELIPGANLDVTIG